MRRLLPFPSGLVLALLATHAGLLLHSSRHNFVVVDEVAHIPAGIVHWQTGSFALYRVNPPLPRMLATAVLLPARPAVPHIPAVEPVGYRREFEFGRHFSHDNAARYFDLVCRARWSGIAWSLLGGWLIYRWACELHGPYAGLLALTIWCFEPNVLAFAPLVVPDLPATVAALASAYAFWQYLRCPSFGRATLAGLLLGVALLTKFTLLIFWATWPVLWVINHFRTARLAAHSGRCPTTAHLLWLLLLSLVVVHAG